MLPMAELRSALSNWGFEAVRTHLQSGNVIVDPGKSGLRTLSATLEKVITDEFALEVRVIVRTRKELATIAAKHPLGAGQSDGSLLHVIFLERAPSAAKVADLDPDRSPPDSFEVRGREIYVSYPDGQGRSKLSLAYFERVLGVAGTARNWKSVTKLLEMMG